MHKLNFFYIDFKSFEHTNVNFLYYILIIKNLKWDLISNYIISRSLNLLTYFGLF